MEGATVMRRRRRAIEGATEIYDGDNGDCDGRRDRATAVAASNGCRRRDNNQLATAAMDSDSATATQQRQRQRRWSARRSDGDGRRCGDVHEKYNNQLAKAAMDGATAMDGDGRCNRATAMAAMGR
jgi:hypothetical protein